MAMTSHPTPWCVIYLHGGQWDSRGLPHSSTEVEGPLKAKPHPSRQSVLCDVPHRGILWENIDYFILIIVGEDGRVRGGDVWDWMCGECHRGLGSIHMTADSHHTWFLVRPQGRIHRHLNFLYLNIGMQLDGTYPVVKFWHPKAQSFLNYNYGYKPTVDTQNQVMSEFIRWTHFQRKNIELTCLNESWLAITVPNLN